jgi:hypothetical protein
MPGGRDPVKEILTERLSLRPFREADWFKGEWTTLRTYAVLRWEWNSRRAAG